MSKQDFLPTTSIFNRSFPGAGGEFFPTALDFFNEFEKNWARKPSGLTVFDDKKNNIVVEADLPGLEDKEIEASIENGFLWIKGEKKEEESDRSKQFYSKSTTSYFYRLELPEKVDESKVISNFKNGRLTLTFPKSNQSKAKRIEIKQQPK